jgi:uncharacterized protein
MIIDIHTHINNERIYQGYFSKARKKIKKALVMAWYKESLNELLDFAALKDNLFIVGTIDVEKNIENQLKKLNLLFQEKKIFGLKLYPGYQYFYPSDKKIYPIAKFCQEYNKPLIFHSGDFYDTEGKALLKYSRPIYIDELAVKFPKCKIIISHFGFPYFMEAANVISKNDNVYTDISGTIDNEFSCLEEGKKLFNQYVLDLKRVFAYFPDLKKKVMFGTDYSGEESPLSMVNSYIALVEKVFSKKEQVNVFYKLANKLFFDKLVE